ncbi:hypothetical protein K504DRAFT_375422 [Pleomassaria siparia CBS 279.74]|uniref:Uncharacterized protein n=1 Tax=Pleomassaria siparia CBS 279.74 TaxID=1314801 RepID=A0A6G1KDC3_9PLEO|nr:hypothetical protein K504DRAFT_375422 [Pleomassaria siparia CBS 279.74]
MTGTKCTSVTTVIQTDAHTSFYKPSALSSHTKPINIVPSGTGTGIRNSGSRRGSVGEPVRTISEGSKRTKAYYASRKTKPGKEQDAADVFFAKARLYLSPPDRETGPNWLQPEAKRQTFLLAAWLSNTANPPPCWSCYYDFGYVTCQNEDEAQLLGGLYNAVLNDPDRGPKEATFEQLWQALDTPSLLIDLLDSCGYLDALRTQLPRLEHFLGTRSEDRPSVWRLIQFVRDTPNTEPHACLRRDYGFDSCTLRDEVQALKYIYGEVLAMTATTTKTTTTTQTQTHPLQLHAACIRGTLFEFARSKAGAVIVRDEHRRLMQNMAPSSPFIGFDNDKGLKGYTAPLFKKLQK